jgi:thiosulfate reductase/polysulfide reductase chain A
MVMGFTMTYGTEAVGGDYENTKYIIYNGRNVLEGIANSETQDFMGAYERGAHVVVLDPRFSKSATKANDWLPVRPGGDLAFFLAVNHVIVKENLYDKKFVEEHTIGFAELAEGLKEYTPEWAEPHCDIPAAKITEVARGFAKAAPAAFADRNWRTSNTLNSFQTERAIAILNTLVGNWKQPGGLHPAGGHGGGMELGSIPQPPYPRVSAMRLDMVPMKYPLVPFKLGVFQELRDNIVKGKPYQAKGWLIFRQNPIMSICDRNKTLEAIKKLDLIVTIDIIPNDTAYYADVILPESSYLERYDPLSVAGNRAFLRQPVVQPIHDTKSALQIFKLLGERLDLNEFFNYTDEKGYINAQLKPFNATVADIQEKGYFEAPAADKEEHHEETFQTPSGKIEIVSAPLGQVGFSTIPKWNELPKPEADQFYLLSGKVAHHTQSATQNNQWLAEFVSENDLWINPSAAQSRGISNGDMVTVESKVGKLQVKAKVTEGIRPDCVWMNFGFGHQAKGLTTAYGKGALDSDVHESITDRVSGSQALSQTMVTVSKATA